MSLRFTEKVIPKTLKVLASHFKFACWHIFCVLPYSLLGKWSMSSTGKEMNPSNYYTLCCISLMQLFCCKDSIGATLILVIMVVGALGLSHTLHTSRMIQSVFGAVCLGTIAASTDTCNSTKSSCTSSAVVSTLTCTSPTAI